MSYIRFKPEWVIESLTKIIFTEALEANTRFPVIAIAVKKYEQIADHYDRISNLLIDHLPFDTKRLLYNEYPPSKSTSSIKQKE